MCDRRLEKLYKSLHSRLIVDQKTVQDISKLRLISERSLLPLPLLLEQMTQWAGALDSMISCMTPTLKSVYPDLFTTWRNPPSRHQTFISQRADCWKASY